MCDAQAAALTWASQVVAGSGPTADALADSGGGGGIWGAVGAIAAPWAEKAGLAALPSLGAGAGVVGGLAVLGGLAANQSDIGRPLQRKDVPILIGESQASRVSPAAAAYGAEEFFAPTDALMSGQLHAKMIDVNRTWIRDAIKAGRPILDIGLNTSRGSRGEFYAMEKAEAAAAGYAVTGVFWPPSVVFEP